MTEPTDAELDTVLCNQWPAFSMQATLVRVWVRAAMRDALAKWGAPAGEGEVVACGNCGGTGWMVRDPDIGTDQECFVCDGSGGYSESATPQPTQPQAGAVPMSHAQAKALVLKYSNDPLHLVLQVERHHGIKGGQHGAE